MIRPASISDTPSIVRLASELGYPSSDEEMMERVGMASADPLQAVFVAEQGAVIGWIHVAIGLSLESGRKAEIRGLVVTEQSRGNGVGAQLVAAAEGWTREQGCDRIRVRTNIVRTATHDFYRKLGYQGKKQQVVFDKTLEDVWRA